LASSSGTIQGGYWDDTTAISFPARIDTRLITISGSITFGPNVQTEYALQPVNVAAYVADLNNGVGAGFPNNIFRPDQILLPNGQELYSLDQAANYVPFLSATGPNVPAAWVGLTNAQL
jgi:hypothetical protein